MGILDRLRGKAHQHHESQQERAALAHEREALAHDEASDAYSAETERAREEAQRAAELKEQDERRASDMTSEGDPWD
ncbi:MULTISPECIES: hypothetical protein [Kitasatospora]|uniref:Small hydrophilic protein n=1 Tax=Kitasatospora cystarginea TaxID=58350 RepID=A0ABN3DT46_9ACTN